MSRISTIAFAFVAALGTAHAEFVSPSSLLDGANDEPSVQQELNRVGLDSSVGTESEGFVEYGDQVSTRGFQFTQPGAKTWSIDFQNAGYKDRHLVGYYTDFNSATPAVTWLIGGIDTGLSTTAEVFIPGVFGLAFGSGDNSEAPFDSTIYYAEPELNASSEIRASVFKNRIGGELQTAGLTLAWEDGGDFDYNDLGTNLGGIESVAAPVPEPASMAVLGLGLAALKRRRAAKKS